MSRFDRFLGRSMDVIIGDPTGEHEVIKLKPLALKHLPKLLSLGGVDRNNLNEEQASKIVEVVKLSLDRSLPDEAEEKRVQLAEEHFMTLIPAVIEVSMGNADKKLVPKADGQ